ncbi:hypothetical protein TBR22_A15880 [Luteitalea sp. TBR-22]|uniref:protein kinase domain-containing protein n=1 Tax=Luteitalea sp. TBR-22 TaxID=2802971 RepID=UPI001AF57AFD|nr:protein kinase [Luteitalea sp. TBR-22]BCS32378.1 hypothetical protein TBR22_A15880 [Luteitalea sp. TBR-22]
MIGTGLGPYQVVAKLGEGGMGQVYRATDTRLKRQVAIKILPAAVAADRERLARFQREAEVLASLNHPNIAAIYGLEESDGLTALVMELVEGEDLSQRITRGAIALDEALPIARQIAEALEAAHEQGIIHRDLKPANIKVRPDGTVKVLDFGLAKALATEGASATAGVSASMSPTMTSPAMTQMGMILGTAAYMAPEQARGKAVDRRADIWAFGVVLYEMLTGRRAFDGEDTTEVLGAVVRLEPPWDALPPTVPARVSQALRLCLRKDPKQRVGDIRDVRLALEGAFETAAPADVAPPPVAAPRSLFARALPAVAAVLVVALGAAVWALWRAETPTNRPLLRLDVDLGAEVAFPNGSGGSTVVISPDGMRLVYVSGTPSRLFTRRLDQSGATELPGTEGAANPFFSPDGQWVGFAVGRTVKKISVDGGAVVPLGDVSAIFAGGSWAEDGSIFVADASGEGLLQLPAAGGTPKVVVARGDVNLVQPQALPGGKALLFCAGNPGTSLDAFTIEVVTLADSRRKILVRGGTSPRYLPSSTGIGHLLYTNRATTFAIPFDVATLETRGTAVPVLDDVAYNPSTGGGQLAVSPSGTVIYRRATRGAAVMTTVQWLDAAGNKEPLRATPGAYQDVRLSPDGTRVALVIRDGSNHDVWVYEARRDALTRLTFGGANAWPAWSLDGQYVVFHKTVQGIFQARADGGSPPHVLVASKTDFYPQSLMPDGKRLAYFTGQGMYSQIWTVPLDDQGGQLKAGTPERFFTSTFSDQHPSFSPDGRWLAYSSDESGRREVYVRPFPSPSTGQGGPSTSLRTGKWQISNSGGTSPQWSRTGRELVYQSGDQLMTVSYTVNGPSFVADKPRVWMASFGGTDWDLAPDGKRVAALIPEGPAQPRQAEHLIVMLQNFADHLRRQVPLTP